jgi:tetratricopeptide (TPR) repeat protein
VNSTAGKNFVNFFPRLFRNAKGIEFEGKVHERISPAIERLGLTIEPSGITIKHSGYSLSPEALKAKARRNASLLLEEVKARPGDALTLFHLGEAYAMMDRYEDAVEWYEKALAAGGLDKVVHGVVLQNRGTALVKIRRYEEAIVSLRKAREVAPGLLTVHLVLASALFGMKKFERAERELVSYISRCRDMRQVSRITLSHDPDIPNALVLLAKCRLAGGRLAGARTALEDALGMNESEADAHLLLARIAFEELKFGQAAVHYEKALEAYPQEERLHFELARAYVACGSTDKAIVTIEAAVGGGIESADLLRCLGLLRIKKKDFSGAVAAYRRALELDPADTDARRKLAGLYMADGRSDLAREMLATR